MKKTIIIGILTICSLSVLAQEKVEEQERRMAVVETSTCYMRQKPDYESALETQELMGTIVEIVDETGYWREIVSPQPYKAWVNEKVLVEMSLKEIKEYDEAVKYMFTDLYGHVYSKPSEKSPTICDLVGGDIMRPVLSKGGRKVAKGKWAQVMLPSGKTGWVIGKALKPLGQRKDIRQGDTSEGLISSDKMEDIIASAMQLVGSPYLWGGMSAKGVDCSGLVRISCIMNDVLLPRNASQMIRCGVEVEVPVEEQQNKYDKEAAMTRTSFLKRGDLVFFGTPASDDKPMRVTHVGIYLGEKKIIHSSQLVRINSLIPGDEDYYENSHRLIAARRFIAD